MSCECSDLTPNRRSRFIFDFMQEAGISSLRLEPIGSQFSASHNDRPLSPGQDPGFLLGEGEIAVEGAALNTPAGSLQGVPLAILSPSSLSHRPSESLTETGMPASGECTKTEHDQRIWCEGDCPPLYRRMPDDTCKEITGKCILAETIGRGGAPGEWTCVCAYEFGDDKVCTLAQNPKTKQFSCKGECPRVFSSKEDCENKKKAPDKMMTCELYVVMGSAPNTLEYRCYCTPF